MICYDKFICRFQYPFYQLSYYCVVTIFTIFQHLLLCTSFRLDVVLFLTSFSLWNIKFDCRRKDVFATAADGVGGGALWSIMWSVSLDFCISVLTPRVLFCCGCPSVLGFSILVLFHTQSCTQYPPICLHNNGHMLCCVCPSSTLVLERVILPRNWSMDSESLWETKLSYVSACFGAMDWVILLQEIVLGRCWEVSVCQLAAH
jgi:hypothetical protein